MRIVIFFILSVMMLSCISLRSGNYEDVFVARGYYFVIQLHSVRSDTILFETVEIYSPSPILDISDSNLDSSRVYLVKLPMKNYNVGYLKGVKKKSIGDVFLLYTNSDRITKDNFVMFDYIDHPELTDLSKLYRLGE